MLIYVNDMKSGKTPIQRHINWETDWGIFWYQRVNYEDEKS